MPPSRIWLAIWIITMIQTYTTYAQYFSSARGTALAAYSAIVNDPSALDWNPAGLSRISNWELGFTGYFTLTSINQSLLFHEAVVARKFSPQHSGALRISPSTKLDFSVPTTFIYDDSSAFFITQYDKQISYRERFSAGYAFQPYEKFSVGLSTHYIEESVTDTRYSIDTSSFIRTSIVEESGSRWLMDIGLLWEPATGWSVGLVSKNIGPIMYSRLSGTSGDFGLNLPKFLRAGVSYSGFRNILLGAEGDTKKLFRMGGEWLPLPTLQIQTGLYLNGSSALKTDAISVGLGGEFQNIRVNLSYLAFLLKENRRGSTDIITFRQSSFDGLEYNSFTGDRLTVTARYTLGNNRGQVARIESVEFTGDIFPSSRNVYAFVPVGKARVKNISDKAIEAKVGLQINNFMDAPTETAPEQIAPGGVADIPLFAVLNTNIESVGNTQVKEAEVFVNVNAGDGYDDRFQSRLVVRGKNDWNGDVHLLKYFVTPDDPAVIKFSRNSLVPHKTHLDTLPGMLQNFAKAKIVFNEFASQIQYVGDPKTSRDFVQYPAETLTLHGGDCDDMSVCYAALLGSIGISTAFIDVVPPEKPEESHIFLMFDTGLEPSNAQRVSNNPKRYIVRKNDKGVETVWIPVEPTAIQKGFDEAWVIGTEEYIQAAEVQLGIVKGWVRLVDVEVVN